MIATSRYDRLLSVPEQRAARVALESLAPRSLLPRAESSAAGSLIFLHGPAGCGKTHLVNWLLNQLPRSGASILILDADANFKSERSTRGGAKAVEIDDEPDLLIVENLQFLAPSSVETFIGRLDSRHAHDLPTVVTASAGPRHLQFRGKPFPARLTSRLAAGLVVAVAAPQLESRRIVLDVLLRDAKLSVPENVVAHLAKHGRGLRSLAGAVSQLELLSRLEPGPLKAGPLLDHFQKQSVPEPTSVERIVQRVAGYFQVAAKDVRSRSRRRGFVVPRHISMYLARQLTSLSLQQIGAYFGGCDHATVLHACRKMELTLEADPQLGGTIRQLHDDLA